MRERVPWLVVCGLAMGMAVGTKFTGLTAGMLVLALLLDEFLNRKTAAAALICIRQCVWIGFPFLLIYLAGWVLHFRLLEEAGSGYAFYRPSGEFFRDLVRLNQIMLASNYNLTVSHPDASAWWSWPFMVAPVFYWGESGRVIYLAGNPFVWWSTVSITLTAFMLWLLEPVTRLRLPDPERCAVGHRPLQSSRSTLVLWVPIFGYAAAYLPMVGIPRSLFLYHYIPALLFALVFVVLWLERCGWTLADRPLVQQPAAYWVVLIGAVAGFLAMLPLTAGMAGFEGWRSFVFELFPGWR
jgi:dolichyl-phosphate-mannose--protein O-mannosyl transferase